MREKIIMICPATYTNKVSVIKAIRTITGLGLKEAKDASERPGVKQTFELIPTGFLNSLPTGNFLNELNLLKSEGVQIFNHADHILDTLRGLATEAIQQGDDELGNEILQLVLAEKLRRAK